jgi:AcrR family transcriptional regulator
MATRERLTAAERRERIRAAALEVFAEHGYDGAPTRELAARAGVTTPILYDHFGSKRDLYRELLEREAAELLAVVSRPPRSGDPVDYLREPVDAFFAFVEQHRFAWRMLFRDPPADPELADVQRAIQRRATAAIAALFALTPRWRLGLGRDRANELLAELTKSALNGLAGWWWEHPEVRREQLVELATDALWTGLERLREEADA